MSRRDTLHWLRNLLCGILIGAGAILPGVSGGVLAVIFDVYQPFMELLTHPRKALPKYRTWIPPLAIGWSAGFLGFAKGISILYYRSDAVAIWLFIGLIIGTIPSLFREAGKEGRSPAAWVSLAVCFFSVFLGLFYVSEISEYQVTPNCWWYVFCGALWGVGIIVPGMTTSSIMMALDLYQPMLDGLSSMDLSVLLPTIPGMLGAIALLARLVSWLFRRFRTLASHGILGIVLASTLVIVPREYAGPVEIALSVLCCIGGFLLAFFLARLDRRISAA